MALLSSSRGCRYFLYMYRFATATGPLPNALSCASSARPIARSSLERYICTSSFLACLVASALISRKLSALPQPGTSRFTHAAGLPGPAPSKTGSPSRSTVRLSSHASCAARIDSIRAVASSRSSLAASIASLRSIWTRWVRRTILSSVAALIFSPSACAALAATSNSSRTSRFPDVAMLIAFRMALSARKMASRPSTAILIFLGTFCFGAPTQRSSSQGRLGAVFL
mmetsp:Transcript_67311/g.152308  ORF Transcript_67311/g.152308 Transcript_67311/m.152308 type:complete len:227 (-) Transcript_67311:70-750(-)